MSSDGVVDDYVYPEEEVEYYSSVLKKIYAWINKHIDAGISTPKITEAQKSRLAKLQNEADAALREAQWADCQFLDLEACKEWHKELNEQAKSVIERSRWAPGR